MTVRPICLLVALFGTVNALAESNSGPIKRGDKMQALVNLHPDVNQRSMHSINYQLSGRIPVCADITIRSVHSDKIAFLYQGERYHFDHDGYTQSTKIPFQQVFRTFFGPKCDSEKIKSLSDIDRDGIARGVPDIGMSRDGVYIAMGRPPFHANPDLNVSEWMYWRNRFGRIAVRFDSAGKVVAIK
jgi:hypothetical protein